MKIHKKNYQFVPFILLFICLTSAACRDTANNPDDTPLIPITSTPTTPTHVDYEDDWTPSATPPVTPATTPAASPTSTPTPEPTPTSIPELPASNMQLNYSSGFPIFRTDYSTLTFSYYNDEVIIKNADNQETTYHLSEQIQPENLDLSDPEMWYYIGAFSIGETVYAHFDYYNTEEQIPSILIAIDTSTNTFSCPVISRNPKKHFTDSFTCIDNIIYYTATTYTNYGTVIGEVRYFDTATNEHGVLFTGNLGDYFPFITAWESSLCYVLTDLSQINSLYLYDTKSAVNECRITGFDTPEFFSTWRDYIFLSTTDNKLTYFSLAENKMQQLALLTDVSYYAGQPMTDNFRLYIPLYQNNSASATILTVFPHSASIGQPIFLNTEASHIIGMLDSDIYTETPDGYRCYSINKLGGQQ